MGFDNRNTRDGTGPHRDSFRRRIEGKEVGRRIEAGEECPFQILDSNKFEKEEGRSRLCLSYRYYGGVS